jgi:ABC-type transporter Mla subunit MlaD
MGKIEELKQLLQQVSQESKQTAQHLEGLAGKLRKSQGTANQVGSQLGRGIAQALADSEKQTKAAGQSLMQLSRQAQQEMAKLP